MKHFFLVFLLFIGSLRATSSAQNMQDKEFNFYYVSHDRQTNVQGLTRELQNAFDNLKEYGNAGIFYLANGEEPFIVRVNLPNENEKEFPHFIGELQEKLAHDVAADYDVERILTLMKEHPFLDDSDVLLYSTVNWNYYISSFFWSMTYNESVIGTLYWAMDMDVLKADKEFYINILRSPEDEIPYELGMAMGIKNYCDINSNIAIVPYQ